MGESTYNRLARGYVRYAIKNCEEVDPQTFGGILQLISERAGNLFRRGKRLTVQQVESLKEELSQFCVNKLKAFGFARYGKNGELQTTECYYYSSLGERQLYTNNLTEEAFKEHSVELRMQRFLVDRKRVIVQDSSCNISFSWHALVRMVERGEVDGDPLEYLKDQLELIVGLNFMFVAAFCKSPGLTMVIPLKRGILLTNPVFSVLTKNATANSMRLQFVCDRSGIRMDTNTQAPQLVDHEGHHLTSRMTTYLSNDQFTDVQESAVSRLRKFIIQYDEPIRNSTKMCLTPERTTDEQRNEWVEAATKLIEILATDDYKSSFN